MSYRSAIVYEILLVQNWISYVISQYYIQIRSNKICLIQCQISSQYIFKWREYVLRIHVFFSIFGLNITVLFLLQLLSPTKLHKRGRGKYVTERNVTVAMTGKRNILVVNSPLSKATKKKLKACQHEKQNRERIILPPEKENQTNMRFFFFLTLKHVVLTARQNVYSSISLRQLILLGYFFCCLIKPLVKLLGNTHVELYVNLCMQCWFVYALLYHSYHLSGSHFRLSRMEQDRLM